MKTVNKTTYILKQITGDQECVGCVTEHGTALCEKLSALSCLIGEEVWVEAPPETPGLSEEQNRAAFEEACLVQFSEWRSAGNSVEDNGCPQTRESLCWRIDTGEYGVRALNAAWWGWNAGKAA